MVMVSYMRKIELLDIDSGEDILENERNVFILFGLKQARRILWSL